MGCDIHGYVEVVNYWEWDDCINIRSIIGRNYGMFALLFGVRNDAKYIPIAPDRGLPELLSDRAKKDFEEWGPDAHSPSWITWKEIQGINWNEQGTQLADRVFCYHPGEKEPFSSFGWSSMLDPHDYDALDRGETVQKFDRFEGSTVLYRRMVQKTSDALSSDWKCLFDLMKRLDEFQRADNGASRVVESTSVPILPVDDSKVRLVVWFDN